MKIELLIDGEKKLFTVPFVPMLARRKCLEIQIKQDELNKSDEGITAQKQLDLDDEFFSILVEVFNHQFSLEELYKGASQKYVDEKLLEAVWGVKPESELKEGEEGNETGE